MHDGSAHANYALYHDRYERTSHGWRFSERVYEVRYVDVSPLRGSTPPEAPVAPSGLVDRLGPVAW